MVKRQRAQLIDMIKNDIFNILQWKGDANSSCSPATCFFCKRRGHAWHQYFRIHNILQQNGKGDGPFGGDLQMSKKKAIMVTIMTFETSVPLVQLARTATLVKAQAFAQTDNVIDKLNMYLPMLATKS